uniref:Uncharacterized protein n=1 Tax=Strigamia maritima TaxID=126957 RepID=T1JNN6_STRMM
MIDLFVLYFGDKMLSVSTLDVITSHYNFSLICFAIYSLDYNLIVIVRVKTIGCYGDVCRVCGEVVRGGLLFGGLDSMKTRSRPHPIDEERERKTISEMGGRAEGCPQNDIIKKLPCGIIELITDIVTSAIACRHPPASPPVSGKLLLIAVILLCGTIGITQYMLSKLKTDYMIDICIFALNIV